MLLSGKTWDLPSHPNPIISARDKTGIRRNQKIFLGVRVFMPFRALKCFYFLLFFWRQSDTDIKPSIRPIPCWTNLQKSSIQRRSGKCLFCSSLTLNPSYEKLFNEKSGNQEIFQERKERNVLSFPNFERL